MGIYDTQINSLLSNPGSYAGTPGYQFAFDQGQQALERSNAARQLGGVSGNALTDLVKYGQGMASQNYGDFLKTMMQGQGQQNQFSLGQQQNANTAQGNLWNYQLGQQRNANDAWNNQANFGLGMYNAGNNFALGQQRNANDAAANWWNAGTNAYNAQTQRGQAQSGDWWRQYQSMA